MVLLRDFAVWLLPFLQGVRAVDHDENDKATVLTTSITVPSGSAAVVDFIAIGIGGSSSSGSSTPTTSFTSTALHSGYRKENLTTSITIPTGSIPVVHFTPIYPRNSHYTPSPGASGSTRGGARTRTSKQSAGSSTPASTVTRPRSLTKTGKSSSHKSPASETGSPAHLSTDTTSSSSSTRGAHTTSSGSSSGKASATSGLKSSVSGGSTASSSSSPSQSATGGASLIGTDTSRSTDTTGTSRSSTSTNGAHHPSDPSGSPRSSSKLSTGTSTGSSTGSSTGTSTGSTASGTGTSSTGSTTASQPTVSTTWSSAEDILAVSGSLTGSSSEWLAAIVEYEPTSTPSEVAWGTLTAAPTATTSGAASDQGIILAGRWKLLWNNRNDIKDKTSRKKYKGELNELLDDTTHYSETNDIDTSKSGCSGSLKKRSLFSDIGSTLSTAENAVKDIGSSAASTAANIASGALGDVLGCISEVGKEIDANLPDDVEDLPDDKMKTVENLTDDMVDLTDFWQSVEEQVEKKEKEDITSQSDSQSSTKSDTESSSATSSSSKSSSSSSCSSVTFTDCFDDKVLGTKSIILTNNATSVTHWSTVTTTCLATSGCFSTPTTIQSTTKVACVAREVPLTSGASGAATGSTGTTSKTSTSTASGSSDQSSSGSDSTTSTTSTTSTSSTNTSSTSTKSTSTTSSASASPTAEIYIAFNDESMDPEWQAFVVKSGDADEDPNLCKATPASSWEASNDIKIGDLPFPPKHTFSAKSDLPGCVYAPGDDSAGTFACVNLETTCTTDFKGYAKERVCGNTPIAAKVLCQLSSSDESYDG